MDNILDKVCVKNDGENKITEELCMVKQSFELFSLRDEISLLLVDSDGEVLSGKESEFCRRIANGKAEKTSFDIEQFGGNNGCPVFYVMTDAQDRKLDLKNLGGRIEKNFMLLNGYKAKYDFLVTYLDAVQEGISAVDMDGVLVFVNKACCEMLGSTKDELLYKKAASISKESPLLLEVIKNRQAVVDKEYFMGIKNIDLHLTSSAYPVFDRDGKMRGAIDIFRSINRSRKLANFIAGKEAVFKFDSLIGSSKIMQDTLAKAKRMALSSETILIEGASGCGKELFAQAIHNYSDRKNEAFIAVNCANFPNELVESELFGYEEGAFTGAVKGGKPGKFELANGGTLFLDEIGEMPLHIQTKLLRAVEYKRISRVGGSRMFNADVRIIAATNKNLQELVRDGKFRGDLFYRLKVFYIKIPSLSERGCDIVELAESFVRKFSIYMKKDVASITEDAKKLLMQHDWPGNVRELENSMARAVFLCDDNIISEEQIIEAGIEKKSDLDSCGVLDRHRLYELSPGRIKEAYEQANKNKKRTAELLGISRPTLYKMLDLYGIK